MKVITTCKQHQTLYSSACCDLDLKDFMTTNTDAFILVQKRFNIWRMQSSNFQLHCTGIKTKTARKVLGSKTYQQCWTIKTLNPNPDPDWGTWIRA